jgi:Outer membrane protein beta-barrel domain
MHDRRLVTRASRPTALRNCRSCSAAAEAQSQPDSIKRMLRRSAAIFNVLFVIAVILSVTSSDMVWAQNVPWIEIGPIFSSTPFLIGFPSDARGFGFGGRLVLNPHANVAGEVQVSKFPSLDTMEGSGVTAIAHLKVSARLENRLKFNVFALAGPGWMREHTVCCGAHLSEDDRSSLVWDVGGGVEFVPIRHVSVRTDFTGLVQTRTFTSVPSMHYDGFNFTVGVLSRWDWRK